MMKNIFANNFNLSIIVLEITGKNTKFVKRNHNFKGATTLQGDILFWMIWREGTL